MPTRERSVRRSTFSIRRREVWSVFSPTGTDKPRRESDETILKLPPYAVRPQPPHRRDLSRRPFAASRRANRPANTFAIAPELKVFARGTARGERVRHSSGGGDADGRDGSGVGNPVDGGGGGFGGFQADDDFAAGDLGRTPPRSTVDPEVFQLPDPRSCPPWASCLTLIV